MTIFQEGGIRVYDENTKETWDGIREPSEAFLERLSDVSVNAEMAYAEVILEFFKTLEPEDRDEALEWFENHYENDTAMLSEIVNWIRRGLRDW